SKVAETRVLTWGRKTPTSMSTMMTIMSSVITTCGMAPIHVSRARMARGWKICPASKSGESTREEGPMRGRLFGAAATVLLVVAVALSGGHSPASGQAKPGVKKLDFPHITTPPESSAVAFKSMCEELTKRSGGSLNVVFHGATLLTKELEVMDAVKSGNVAFGNPGGAACTVFPEMCVFLTPFLVRDYNHAYTMFNGEIGRNLDEIFQKKYKPKVMFFYDYGFRHFWNNRRPINTPADLKGLKMRVQQGRVFADTVN